MENYLIIARSVTYAQRMQNVLGRAGIRCPDLPCPPGPDRSGLRLCGADPGGGSFQSPDRPAPGIVGPCSDFHDAAKGSLPRGGAMIYFDSAATTFQKPPAVAAAVEDALRTMSSPGRGGYPAAMRARRYPPLLAGANWQSCTTREVRSRWSLPSTPPMP